MILLALLLGLAAGIATGERTLRVLRTELNSARANEQLLLTRLASRSPAEFHAVTSQVPAERPTFDGGNNRYLFDETGLVSVVDEDAD